MKIIKCTYKLVHTHKCKAFGNGPKSKQQIKIHLFNKNLQILGKKVEYFWYSNRLLPLPPPAFSSVEWRLDSRLPQLKSQSSVSSALSQRAFCLLFYPTPSYLLLRQIPRRMPVERWGLPYPSSMLAPPCEVVIPGEKGQPRGPQAAATPSHHHHTHAEH